MHLWDSLFIYGAQVVQGIPGPHKSICEWCTYLGGEVLQLDPLRLTFVLEFTWCSLKGELKGKGELGPCKDFHCTPVLVYYPPSSFLSSYCLFALNWHFWWGNGVKGPKMIPFWCLMPKGKKLRPKQMDQLPLENFENSRVRTFDLLLLSNFGTWSIFPLEYLSLCLNKCVWLRDRKMNLICKNKPSGGKRRSKYVKSCQRQICSQLHWYYTSVGCFWMCWHKSPKRGRLKGKCAFGQYYVLVIKCPTHLIEFLSAKWRKKWKSKRRYVSRLSSWFLYTNEVI
jgi:hypothetical protein